MTRNDDMPDLGTPAGGRDERIRDERTVGREQPAPGAGDEGAGLQQRFEHEAVEGVEAADRDAAALKEQAAEVREEAADLDRSVAEPDDVI